MAMISAECFILKLMKENGKLNQERIGCLFGRKQGKPYPISGSKRANTTTMWECGFMNWNVLYVQLFY